MVYFNEADRVCQANAIVDPLPKVKLTPLVFGSVRWPLGFQGRRAMQPEPGLALLPEPIALALDHEGVAVMQESIEDGGGDDVVAEDLTPLRHALPSAYRDVVEHGGLMSYGVKLSARWRCGPVFIDMIFCGPRPADSPNEQPRKFELAINAKTAKRLGRRSRLRCFRADKIIG